MQKKWAYVLFSLAKNYDEVLALCRRPRFAKNLQIRLIPCTIVANKTYTDDGMCSPNPGVSITIVILRVLHGFVEGSAGSVQRPNNWPLVVIVGDDAEACLGCQGTPLRYRCAIPTNMATLLRCRKRPFPGLYPSQGAHANHHSLPAFPYRRENSIRTSPSCRGQSPRGSGSPRGCHRSTPEKQQNGQLCRFIHTMRLPQTDDDEVSVVRSPYRTADRLRRSSNGRG